MDFFPTPPDQHRPLAASLQQAFGVPARLTRAAGENDNYFVELADGRRAVLKLAEPGATRERIDFEHAVVEAAEAAGLDVVLPRLLPGRQGDVVLALADEQGRPRLGRLLQLVPGHVWGQEVPAGAVRLRQLGQVIGGLSMALPGCDGPAARVSHAWDLAMAGSHQQHLGAVDDAGRRALLQRLFDAWPAVQRALAAVPHSVIHGDLNDDNLLLQDGRLAGVLDFGDALWNPLVNDLAIALAYVLLDEPQPWAAGAEVLAGYRTRRALQPAELELLYPLLCLRLAVSVLTSARRRRLDPGRAAWFVSERRAWAFLERHGGLHPAEVASRWSVAT